MKKHVEMIVLAIVASIFLAALVFHLRPPSYYITTRSFLGRPGPY